MQKRWQLISDDSVWMFKADIVLSTVLLDLSNTFESCLFFSDGRSDVVGKYRTQLEAEEGHLRLEKKYQLKRVEKFQTLF